MFQGSTYTPQIGNTDCEFVIQLVTFGGYGFFNDGSGANNWDFNYDGASGEDFAAILDLKNIDFGTFHLYTDDNGSVLLPLPTSPPPPAKTTATNLAHPPQSPRTSLRPPMAQRPQRRLRRRGQTLRP